jgi:tetratricopeptide (TPR) repeat protein
MRSLDSDLVYIVRDFLIVHRTFRDVAARYWSGDLRFEQVQALVGETEKSALFRLKERCHALFRAGTEGEVVKVRPEALFDLAVGSLFHETMKFRESLYQRDVYGPKVRALRSASEPEVSLLFREFERIFDGVRARLDESLQEAEILLLQTAGQFRILLEAHAANGFVTRYLIEHGDLVDEVFPDGLDALLEQIHGSPGIAFVRAAHSYLESGFFGEARRALIEAMDRDGSREQLARLLAYAEGMQAYLEGRYGEALDSLSKWVDAAPPQEERRFADLAFAAVSRVGQLVDKESGEALRAAAAQLSERIRCCSSPARSGDSEPQ